MPTKKYFLIAILAGLMLLSACGSLGVEIEFETPTAVVDAPTDEATVTPTVPAATETPTPLPPEADYWVIYQDPGIGFHFALPCFWRVEINLESYDLEGGELYHAFNYPADYPSSFPRGQVPPENGAINVTFDIIDTGSYALAPGASLEDFVNAENSGGGVEIVRLDPRQINGIESLEVTLEYSDPPASGRYFLLRISDVYLLRFTVNPSSKLLDTPDIQGILNSITLDPQAEVPNPAILPGAPPVGIAAPCIPEYAQAVEPTAELLPENTACGPDSFRDLEALIAIVEDYLQNRNTGGLRWDYYIHDPFTIGYWRSEGAVRTPDEAATELANSLYAAADPGGMTFTQDSSQFPSLDGTPPESMLGPDAQIAALIYSEGWGLDKAGAALLYFVQDECGGFSWYGLVYAAGGFQ